MEPFHSLSTTTLLQANTAANPVNKQGVRLKMHNLHNQTDYMIQ